MILCLHLRRKEESRIVLSNYSWGDAQWKIFAYKTLALWVTLSLGLMEDEGMSEFRKNWKELWHLRGFSIDSLLSRLLIFLCLDQTTLLSESIWRPLIDRNRRKRCIFSGLKNVGQRITGVKIWSEEFGQITTLNKK